MDVRVALIIYISWVYISVTESCQWWMCQWPVRGQHFSWGTDSGSVCAHPRLRASRPTAAAGPICCQQFSSLTLCFGHGEKSIWHTSLSLRICFGFKIYMGPWTRWFIFSLLTPVGYFFSSLQFPLYVGKWSLLHFTAATASRKASQCPPVADNYSLTSHSIILGSNCQWHPIMCSTHLDSL